MSIDTAETLHAQHDKGEKWDHDLLIHAVLEMLKGPFNEDNYRKQGPDLAEIIVQDYLKVLKGTKYEKRSNRILRKVAKLEKTKDIVLYLGEVILSD